MAAGAFLFGAMRSYAAYKGKILSGALELGGPAVLSALVVVGGFLLVPNVSPFDLTVYVHGSGGKYDLVLKNEGKVMIDLGDDCRVEGINEKGKVHFPEIPVKFRNQPVSLSVNADGFEVANPEQEYVLAGKSIYVEVKKNDSSTKAIILRGQITFQNSNGKPVPGVQVSAFGASPTKSNTFGQFELKVEGKNPEDYIHLNLKKIGLEVVNRKTLTVILRANSDDLVEILMCEEGERDKYAKIYYEIAEQSVNREYENELRRIKEIHEKDLKQKNDALEKLAIQRDAALSQAKELSEKFAEVNLEKASELYKAAFKLFKEGKIKAAIKVLDDAEMDKNMQRAQKEKRKAEEAIRQCIENYVLKARLCIADFRFEEAEKNYQKAIDADVMNFENIAEFAFYLQKQNQFTKALPLYKKALSLAENESKRAIIFNNLGNLYSEGNEHEKALSAYERALGIREKLVRDNPGTFLPYVANTLNNLGNLYLKGYEHKKALSAYERALGIREKLARDNPGTFLPDLAEIINNFGMLYSDINKHEKALSAYERALEIREKLARDNPGTFLPDLAETLSNLGVLHDGSNEHKKALSAYERALEIDEKLARDNPRRHELNFCTTLINLGIFHNELFDKEADPSHKTKGLSFIERAIPILEKYPEIAIAKEYMTKALSLKIYFESNNEIRIQHREKIIALWEEVYQQHKDKEEVRQQLASSHGSMAWYLLFDRQFKKAEVHAIKGLEIDASQEWINTNLALAYLFTGRYEKAKAIYSEFKDKPYQDGTYKKIFVQDLKELEEAGITHPHVEKIRKFLSGQNPSITIQD